jgi:16S rRNA (cytidine1402-2'-O)-methyltransferase
LQGAEETLVAYESPYRIVETLEVVSQVMGPSRPVCVAREISKMFEEFFRGTAAEALDYFAAEPVRGEITLLIGGQPRGMEIWPETEVRAALRERLASGERRSEAARQVAAESGWNKRDIYALDE